MVFTASLLGDQHKKGIVWRTSRQTCLLCPWAKHLMGRLQLYVADRWPTRTSPGYNCQVANPACLKRRLFGTHQWQSALLVVGLVSVTHDWFKMGCHFSLISTFMWQTGGLPVLHQLTIVKLLTQHVVKGDSWVPTSGSPPCWWWGYPLLMTGSKWTAIFPLA